MKIGFVVNPIAGRGRARRRAERLRGLLEARGHAIAWLVTSGAGDAERCARQLEGRVERIVVAGGDGTVAEAVNGLADPARTPLLPIPVGTANNLVRELGIPRRDAALAELAQRGGTRRVDLGEIAGRRFLTTVSCGFDAAVTEVIRRRRHGRLGFRAYLVAIWETLRSYRPGRLEVRVDEAEPLAGTLVVASNIRPYGGLFVVTEHARCDSGHLDVYVFERSGVRDIARYAAAARLARVGRLDGVTARTGRRVRIEAEAPAPVEVDGDYWGTTPVELHLTPAVVPFVAPPREAATRA